MNQYKSDSIGFYREDQIGRRWRTIDFDNGKPVVDSEGFERRRAAARERNAHFRETESTPVSRYEGFVKWGNL